MADPTVIVGIAGVAGTLAAGALSPWVTAQRERHLRSHDRRTDLYVDLLATLYQMRAAADRAIFDPLAAIDDPSDEELHRLEARATTLVSKPVREAIAATFRARNPFNLEVLLGRSAAQAAHDQWVADGADRDSTPFPDQATAIAIGRQADALKQRIDQLEQVIRRDLGVRR